MTFGLVHASYSLPKWQVWNQLSLHTATIWPRSGSCKALFTLCHFINSHAELTITIYKITKIVSALWLAERSVCMRVCKHGCGVKLFGFSHANHASTNLKKFSSSKLDKFTLFTHSFVGLKHEKSLQRRWVNFSLLKPAFWARKIRILQSIFLQNKNWLRMQDFVDKILRLVRISLLISAIQKVLRFFSWKLFYKSNRKLFPVFA